MKEDNKKKTTVKKSNAVKSTPKKNSASKGNTPKKNNTSKGNTPKKKTTSKSTNGNTNKKSNNSVVKSTTKVVEKKVEPVKKEEVEKEVIKVEPIKVEEVKKEEVKTSDVPVNNYMGIISIVVMIVLIAILVATSYSESIFNKYNSSWDGKSYLVKKSNVHQITCDEIVNATMGNQSFILVTDASGEEEFELEKKLAKVIKDYNIKNQFYVYVLNDNCGPIQSSSSNVAMNLQLVEGLDKIPAILYYRNGYYMDVVMREDNKMINDGDFVHLLDMYEVKTLK